jgi:putative transcriptional regulator
MVHSVYKLILSWFVVLQILSFHFSFTALAEAPKNYLKGKFYRSVKDHFLVATEKMLDDRFKKTVIVMLDHDEKGAWGLIVNRPIGKIPLHFLINDSQKLKNEKKELYNVEIPIWFGGPVEQKQIFVLHSKEYKNEATESYKDISITRDYKILFDIAENRGPTEAMVILGYAGWGDGQLDGEMYDSEHWVLSEIDVDIIFKEDSDNRWLKAYENRFIRL